MLADILGHQSVVASLRHGLAANRLAQTYLFVGDNQIGKTTTARALAKVLLCDNRSIDPIDSCDTCAACRSIDADSHSDVRQIGPTGPSRILRIAQFWPRDGVKEHPADRAMLRDLYFAPVSGKRRIFIVEAAESMNEDTANSLLKVLEEPPSYTLFILTASSVQAVLPTILSRSQTLRFAPVPEPEIAARLIAIGLSSQKATLLAAYAQGRPGIALRAASSPTAMTARDDILNAAEESSSGAPVIAGYKIADDLRKASAKLNDLSSGEEDSGPRTLLASSCDVLVLWYRDLLVSKISKGKAQVLNIDRVDVINNQAQRYHKSEIEEAINLVQDTRRYIARNANAQIATEYLMLNLLSLGR